MASLQIAPSPAPDVPAFELTSAARGGVPSDLLRTLARAILHAREEEGRRIARELHDDAGQLIASAFLALDEVEQSLPEDGRGRLEDAKRTLGQVERHLRRLSHELRPPVLDDLGLKPAVEFLAEGVSARTGIAVEVEGAAGRLPPAIETATYRIVQEALANAARHAFPTRISVRLDVAAGRLGVTVRDDGRGFDPHAAMRQRGRRGLGYICMLERLGALGGTLRIRSTLGRGTELHAAIPLEGRECPVGFSSPTTTRYSGKE